VNPCEYDDGYLWAIGRCRPDGLMTEIDAFIMENRDGRWQWVRGRDGGIEDTRSAAIKKAKDEK